MKRQEKPKSRIVVAGVPVIGGLLLLAGIIYGMLWIATPKARDSGLAQEQEQTASSDAQGQPGRQASSAQPGQRQDAEAPASASQGSQAPPPDGAAPPSQSSPAGLAQASAQGAVQGQAQAKTDSKDANAPKRPSMKSRIEKTAPEDRARELQLRREAMAYRSSHGGGGGGPGGPPPP